MLRIRLFRVLLPVLLIGIVVLLVWAIRPQPPARGELDASVEPKREASGLTFRGYRLDPDGTLVKDLELHARETEECAGEGCYRFRGVDNFELARKDQAPLRVSAESSELSGPGGHRKMRFEGPVRMVDEDLGLVLDLPHLDVDEDAGVARSQGAIYIEGAGHNTRADRLIYGLAGQATELFRLEVEDDAGGLLLAKRAFLHDGIEDVEMVQGVRFRGVDDEQRFWAETAHVIRDESGRMRSLTANGKVVVGFRTTGGFAEVGGEHLDANWNDDGAITDLKVEGRALIEQGPQFVSSDRLDFRLAESGGWDVDAVGSVRMTGALETGTGRVRAEELSTRFDDAMTLLFAEARGDVRFETPDVRADAAVARATRSPGEAGGLQIELLSADGQRARLARAQTRVAADTIRTDARGESLSAAGRVESLLLPAGDSAALEGMFRTDEAVHFISAELEAGRSGRELIFSGNVRGWQGEQNLSAQTVRVDHDSGALLARGGVSTRFPRVREGEGAAAASDDFVQVTAGELDYDRSSSQAIYRQNVRLVFAEGWIESGALTVTQGGEGGRFERLLAEGQVILEFLGIEDGSGEPAPRTTGHADRLLYVPAEDTVWLYGDEQRARIVRGGGQAGTTEGRELTYRLSDGNLSIVAGGSVKAPPPQEKEEAPE